MSLSVEAQRFRAHWCECVRRAMQTVVGDGFETYGLRQLPWDGGQDRFGKRQPELWSRILAAYRAKGLDPYPVVVELCEGHRSVKPPYPNVLLNPQVMELAVTEQDRIDRYLTQIQNERVAFEQLTFDLAKLQQFAARPAYFALMSGQLKMSPLLRYTVAQRLGYERIAQDLAADAAYDYGLHRKIIDKAWPAAQLAVPAEFQSMTTEQLLARRAS